MYVQFCGFALILGFDWLKHPKNLLSFYFLTFGKEELMKQLLYACNMPNHYCTICYCTVIQVVLTDITLLRVDIQRCCYMYEIVKR